MRQFSLNSIVYTFAHMLERMGYSLVCRDHPAGLAPLGMVPPHSVDPSTLGRNIPIRHSLRSSITPMFLPVAKPRRSMYGKMTVGGGDWLRIVSLGHFASEGDGANIYPWNILWSSDTLFENFNSLLLSPQVYRVIVLLV